MIEELKQDHEDEKRVLASQWSEYCADCVVSATWKATLLGFLIGLALGKLL